MIENSLHLTPEQRAQAVEELRKDMFATQTLMERLADPRPTDKGLAQNILQLREACTANVGKLLGLETESASEREARFGQLRAANERARELEAQLGSQGSVVQTAAHLSLLSSKLRHWWRTHGLGHTGELVFTASGGALVKFSCMLMHAPRVPQGEPRLTEEAWYQQLASKGLELHLDPDESRPGVTASDASRQALVKLITERLPSTLVQSVHSHWGRSAKPSFSDIEVFVQDLRDLDALPAPVKPSF